MAATKEQKFAAFKELLGDEDIANAVMAQAEGRERDADEMGLEFKEVGDEDDFADEEEEELEDLTNDEEEATDYYDIDEEAEELEEVIKESRQMILNDEAEPPQNKRSQKGMFSFLPELEEEGKTNKEYSGLCVGDFYPDEFVSLLQAAMPAATTKESGLISAFKEYQDGVNERLEEMARTQARALAVTIKQIKSLTAQVSELNGHAPSRARATERNEIPLPDELGAGITLKQGETFNQFLTGLITQQGR